MPPMLAKRPTTRRPISGWAKAPRGAEVVGRAAAAVAIHLDLACSLERRPIGERMLGGHFASQPRRQPAPPGGERFVSARRPSRPMSIELVVKAWNSVYDVHTSWSKESEHGRSQPDGTGG